MNIIIDTNIFIRLFVKDNKKQHDECEQLLHLMADEQIYGYVPSVVIGEVYYVLRKHYSIPPTQCVEYVTAIVTKLPVHPHEHTDWKKMTTYLDLGLEPYDAMIAGQLTENMILCTYDNDFKKVPSINAKTPREILAFFTP